LQSSQLQLAPLAASFGRTTGGIAGTASGQLAVRWDLSGAELSAQGSGQMQRLVFGRLPVIDSVQLRQFELRGGKLFLPQFQASLWGGTAAGSGTLDFSEGADRTAEFSITELARVDLPKLAAGWPIPGGPLRGRVSGSGRFSVSRKGPAQAVLGSGQFTVESGVFAGLPTGRTVGSIDAFDSASHEIVNGRVQAKQAPGAARSGDQRILITIHEAHPARGTVQGSVLIAQANSGRMTYDAGLRLNALDLATVAQVVFASQHPVSGSLSGEMRFIGGDRGSDDVRGEMWLRVDNGNLWRLPVLAVFMRESNRAVNRLLNLNLAEQRPQTAMARRITLDRGKLYVHEFWIDGDVGKLFGEGTIALDGRINLNFVGNFDTGLPNNVPLIGQINDALNFLQQRLVKFHLTGTLSDPVAIPVPLQDLTEPAEKFFRGVITGSRLDFDRIPRPLQR
jgi:hypothetical protein